MTRELVPGTIAVEGIRPKISPGYVCFIALPLVFMLPLILTPLRYFVKKEQSMPIPRSIWDILVLGRGEEGVVPTRQGSDSPYPPCPTTVKFGIVVDEQKSFDRLGLGHKSFVLMERPLRERPLATSPLCEIPPQDKPDQATPPNKPSHAGDPTECLEV